MTLPLPPGPRQRFPGQHLFQFRRDPIAFLRRVARDWGDTTRFQVGGQSLVLLNHPDDIRDVFVSQAHRFVKGRGLERAKRLLGEGLLTSEGDFHLRQRRLMQPAFHRERIAGYALTMTGCAARTRDEWQAGETRMIDQDMMRLTLAIVGKTLFSADIEAEAGEIGEALTETIHLFHLLALPFAEHLEKLPLPGVRRFHRARARLDATIYRMIETRRQDGRDRGDLLSMLLLAGGEGGEEGMTDRQIRDEAMTLFLAGLETVANALTWTWYLLSEHPEAEQALHTELDRTLAGRLPQADDVPRLAGARQVLAEAMRLYPPAWIIGRRALTDCTVGGFRIPADTVVLLSPAVTHRDARWFPDPGRFDPERWTPAAEAARPRFSFFPFGGGSRICIGEQFAWMEGVLVLATLAQRWWLRRAPGHPVAAQPIITLRPRHGLKMTVHRRED